MKIIDILNKMANGELEDRFKFCFEDEVYTYTKNDDAIRDSDFNKLGQRRAIENYLNEEVLLFKDNNQEGNKEIEELHIEDKGESNEALYEYCSKLLLKQNEVIRAVNKINKERECE